MEQYVTDRSLMSLYQPIILDYFLNNCCWITFLLAVAFAVFVRVSKDRTFYAWLSSMSHEEFYLTVLTVRKRTRR